MYDEALRVVGVLVVTPLAVILLRVIGSLVVSRARVTDVREEGGGIGPKLKGELIGGQRRPSSARAHGLHIRVTADGQFAYRQKSVIAKELV